MQKIPEIKESVKFNFITSIWIVPFVALLIAGWLAYQYYSQLGPEIKILFPKNEGLQVGKSQIKYRDVPIGKVTKIELQEGGRGVVLYARIDKTAKSYLNEHTKFWIVKPEVSMGGVSGLDTLISGTYINMYTKEGTEQKNEFLGLSHAFREDKQGEYFSLFSPKGHNIKQGTPVYFKNLVAGEVEYVNMALDKEGIEYVVYIDKFFIPYLHEDSKFWVRSIFNVDFSSGKLDINVAPFTQLIQGALAFSSTGEDRLRPVSDKFVFHLHKNSSDAKGKRVGSGGSAIKEFEIQTQHSIAKLKEKASVRYEGFDVGSVKQIQLSYDAKSHKMKGIVILAIDTSVFKDGNYSGEKNFYKAVEEGLRAKVTPTDPITGILFVDLVFNENDRNQSIVKGEKYALLPTAERDDDGIMAGVEKILQKVNNLELEKLLASLDEVVKKSAEPVENINDLLVELKQTVKNFNTLSNKKTFASMPDEIDKALKALTRTLKTTKHVVRGYKSDSLLTRRITETLKALTQMSDQLEVFFKMLNRKPNSLIFGDK